MDKKNTINIIFTDTAYTVLSDILKKYNLEESDEDAEKKFEADIDPKEVILVGLIKDFVRQKVSIAEFLDSLHKNLDISPETTKLLAKDIIQELVPLLDKVPEDQLEEYAAKKDEEDRGEQGSDLAQEILRKINAKKGVPVTPTKEAQGNPSVEAPTVSVEENAKQIQQIKRDLNPATDGSGNKPAPDRPAPNRNFARPNQDSDMNPQKLAIPPAVPTENDAKKSPFADEKKGPDSYREPIE